MGLREAVTEIADQMEKEIDATIGPFLPPTYLMEVKSWVKMLRSALKASEGDYPPAMTLGIVKNLSPPEKIKRETRQEETDPTFKLCCGGQSDGVMIPTTPETPATARTWVSGEVYEFDGKQWHFNQSVTEKMRAEMQERGKA